MWSDSESHVGTDESVGNVLLTRPRLQYSRDIEAVRMDARRRSRRVCDNARSVDEAFEGKGDFTTTSPRSECVVLEGVAELDGFGFVRVGGIAEARNIALSGVFDWKKDDVGKIVFVEGQLFTVKYGINKVHVHPRDRLKRNNLRGGPVNTVVKYILPHSVTVILP